MKSCNSTEITTEAGIHNLQKRRDLFVMCASPFVCSSFSAFSSRLPQLAQNRKGRIKPQSLLKHPEGLTEKYKITIITLDHMTRSAPLTQFHRKQEWKLTYVEPRGLTWMLIDWDRSGRTGKCLARGHDAVLGLLGALGPYVLNSSQLLSLPALPLSQ